MDNQKVIIADFGMFLHRAGYSIRRNPMPVNHTILKMMISSLRKIGISEYDKIIVACDGRNSWRKDYDEKYKGDRAEKKEASGFNWPAIYSASDILLQQLDGGTDWHVVKIDRCLSGNTRILTPNGQKHIKNLKKGEEVYSYNIETKKIEISKIKNTQKTNSFHRYNIYFEGAKSPLKITGEHPIYTLKGWKKAKDLKIGNIVWHYFDSKLLNCNFWQEELGYFNGYLLGDGCIDYDVKKVSFFSNDYESIKYLKQIARKIFNIRSRILSYQKSNPKWKKNYRITFQKRQKIYSIINANKFKKDVKYKKGFVAGFFDAEGTFNKERNIIRIINTNESIINYVYKILKDLDFRPKKYKFKSKLDYKPIFAVDLNGKNKVIKFFQIFKTIIKRKKISTISNGLKIKRIEYILEKESYINYNFESYPNNNYFANGLLVHNCEADDIMAVGAKYFKDNEVILLTFDHDLEQCWHYPYVKIFSPLIKFKSGKGAYKVRPLNFNPYKLISSMARKEASDNLKAPTRSVKEYENRELIVNLLDLPDFVEIPIREALSKLEPKMGNLDLLPFQNDLRPKVENLYGDESKIITYEMCVTKAEKKKNKKRRKKK